MIVESLGMKKAVILSQQRSEVSNVRSPAHVYFGVFPAVFGSESGVFIMYLIPYHIGCLVFSFSES